MKYGLILGFLTVISSASFAGNGSGWGGSAAQQSEDEQKALDLPIRSLGVSEDNDILLSKQSLHELVTKSAKGLPVAILINGEAVLVRPVGNLDTGKWELETPDGERIIVEGY